MEQEFDYKKIMDDLAVAFKLTEKEKQAYMTSPAFKIIAAIPYLAKCQDPDRCAYTHLSSAIVASRLGKSSVATFRESDLKGVSRRLDYMFDFISGNRKIIKQGKALLKYNMLLDYKKDFASDIKQSKNNPMNYDSFDLERELVKAQKEIGTAKEYDSLFSEPAMAAIERSSYWMV